MESEEVVVTFPGQKAWFIFLLSLKLITREDEGGENLMKKLS